MQFIRSHRLRLHDPFVTKKSINETAPHSTVILTQTLFHIPSKSPVSATIVVIAFNWSKADTLVFFVCGSLILNFRMISIFLRTNENANCQWNAKEKIVHVESNCCWPPTGMEWIQFSFSHTKMRRSILMRSPMCMRMRYTTHRTATKLEFWFGIARMWHASGERECVCVVIYCGWTISVVFFLCSVGILLRAEWKLLQLLYFRPSKRTWFFSILIPQSKPNAPMHR